MKLPELKLAGRPAWQIVLVGVAIPACIVGAVTLVAIVYAVFDGSNIEDTAKVGLFVGLFFTLLGVLEISAGILFSSKDLRTNALLVVGYLITWAGCLFIIFN